MLLVLFLCDAGGTSIFSPLRRTLEIVMFLPG
jgi:hypothetical protein